MHALSPCKVLLEFIYNFIQNPPAYCARISSQIYSKHVILSFTFFSITDSGYARSGSDFEDKGLYFDLSGSNQRQRKRWNGDILSWCNSAQRVINLAWIPLHYIQNYYHLQREKTNDKKEIFYETNTVSFFSILRLQCSFRKKIKDKDSQLFMIWYKVCHCFTE